MALNLSGKHALVVDDYQSMRLILKERLVELGFAVVEAENGLEGLEKLKTKKFDMVFTDIVMPIMDGLEFCQEIKSSSEFRQTPVVVLSTHTDASYLLKAIANGADDYVPKPVEFKLLDKVIARLLND